MTSFSFFKYFDAFELDVNVVNFVYYGKTRLFSLLNLLYSLTILAENTAEYSKSIADPPRNPGSTIAMTQKFFCKF